MNFILLTILILVSIFCSVAGSIYRLPTNVKPSFYTIKIQPDLDKETFNGSVSVHLKVESFAESIALHNRGLNISSLYLNKKRIPYVADSENSTLYYQFSDWELIEVKRTDGKKIEPGNYVMDISYNGEFSKTDIGFVKGTFTENNNTLSYLAVSDFEPTHARSAFPCFDEPAFKARFQLTLVTPNSSYLALSNTRATKNFKTSYGQVYKFETTPLMSTYILAFAVTQYSYGEFRGNGVPIRAFSYHANDATTRESLEIMSKSMKFYSDYTNFCYPLSKIDIIEYDRTTSTATENWGLITCRSGILTNVTDDFSRNQKVNILAHEISHYWFGNLVTNDWWDDIWLQEGFAVFLTLKAEEYIERNNATQDFLSNYKEETVYWYDQTGESIPIVNFVQTPTDIRKNFNDIIYFKGAAVLLMIERIIGEENFKKAVRCYISKYAYKTASTSDFLDILEDYKPSDMDLRGFVESYIYQKRYPIIHVTKKEDEYVVTQSSCSHDKESSLYGYKWTIPLSYITNGSSDAFTIWFDKDMDNLTIPRRNKAWIKFNPRQVGLYRVVYSEEMWDDLINYAQEFDVYERSHLFLEAIQLFDANVTSCVNGLKFFKMFHETLNKGKKVIDHDQVFVAAEKMKVIEKYDAKAFNCWLNLYVTVIFDSKTIKKTRAVEKHDENETTKETATVKPPKNVEVCIKWIKENLLEYC